MGRFGRLCLCCQDSTRAPTRDLEVVAELFLPPLEDVGTWYLDMLHVAPFHGGLRPTAVLSSQSRYFSTFTNSPFSVRLLNTLGRKSVVKVSARETRCYDWVKPIEFLLLYGPVGQTGFNSILFWQIITIFCSLHQCGKTKSITITWCLTRKSSPEKQFNIE